VGPRAGLDAVEKRKIFPLLGVMPIPAFSEELSKMIRNLNENNSCLGHDFNQMIITVLLISSIIYRPTLGAKMYFYNRSLLSRLILRR
jgi:hypothetical protein